MSNNIYRTGYDNVVAVTTHDTNANRYAGFVVSVTGTVVFMPEDGNTLVTFPATAGIVYPLGTRIITTASTATGILGLL